MTYDLDPADLGEVRRRVVDPVLARALRPGELDSVEVRYGDVEWASYPGHDAVEVWLVLIAGGEEFSTRLVKAIFGRWDAQQAADFLAGELEDWICETSFGWGQLRDVGVDAVPGPRALIDPAGRAVLEFYPEEGAASPLWRGGANVAVEDLPLSETLTSSLREWALRCNNLPEEALARQEADPGLTSHEITSEVERARRRLVDDLRRELPGTYTVAEPIWLDDVHEA